MITPNRTAQFSDCVEYPFVEGQRYIIEVVFNPGTNAVATYGIENFKLAPRTLYVTESFHSFAVSVFQELYWRKSGSFVCPD